MTKHFADDFKYPSRPTPPPLEELVEGRVPPAPSVRYAGCRITTPHPDSGTTFISAKQNFSLIQMVREYGPARVAEISLELEAVEDRRLKLLDERSTILNLICALEAK